jgi:hypothetical protein
MPDIRGVCLCRSGHRQARGTGLGVARCHDALDPGGRLMFDLAGPGLLQAREQPGWTAGPGWVVLVETHVESDMLIREIVTFCDCGRSRYRRSEETHRLQLHRPADVLAQLRHNRFTARTLRPGYGTIAAFGAHRVHRQTEKDECRCIVRRALQRAGLTPTQGRAHARFRTNPRVRSVIFDRRSRGACGNAGPQTGEQAPPTESRVVWLDRSRRA